MVFKTLQGEALDSTEKNILCVCVSERKPHPGLCLFLHAFVKSVECLSPGHVDTKTHGHAVTSFIRDSCGTLVTHCQSNSRQADTRKLDKFGLWLNTLCLFLCSAAVLKNKSVGLEW